MKKILLMLSLFASSFAAKSQQIARPATLNPASSIAVPAKPESSLLSAAEKTLLCADTIRYPQVKEQILNPTPAFYLLDVWAADNEQISQTFLLSGATMSIGGIEFFGGNNTVDGTASLTVRASIYAVNGTYQPTTQLATGTVTFTSATAGYHYVNFAAPINVSANYAVVIQPISTDGVLDIYVNNIAPAQVYDENLARYKSSYYVSSSGNWITIPQFTEIGNYNFEPLVAPIVSYTMNTTALASPDPVCLGNPIVFTSTATPSAILTNRMYNYQVFNTYFGLAPSDSTYVWDMDNLSPYIWTSSTSYTYPAAGVYDATFYVLGGFWESCVDFATDQVTVNATPTISATPSNPIICEGASSTLNPLGGNTYSWDNGIGSVTSPVVFPTTTTTYTVTGTAANGCTSTAQTVVVVNPADNATFTYSSNTFCTSGGNETPTVATSGTFSSTAGLVFVSTTTGEINVSGSTSGTYTVSYTTNGSCPSTSTQSITITTLPDASFTYAQAAYCSAESNPSPVFPLGASAGIFSSTAGLAFVNTSTGQINLSASTPGIYTVMNTINAAGSCPLATASTTVTVNTSPSATVTGGGVACEGSGPITVDVALAGAGPWSVTYSDGTTPTTLLNQSASPLTINATTSGTYTVTNISNANCSAVGTGSAVVTFNANPTANLTADTDLCDNESAITLVGTPAGGIYSGTGVTADSFDPAIGAGTYTVTYTYTDGNNCSDDVTSTITVNPSPTVTLAPFAAVCLQDGAFILSGGLPAGGTYTGTGVTGGQFDPAVAGVGTQNISYMYTDGNSCSSSYSESIVVNDCAGLEEIIGTTITVSPNPAQDQLNITCVSENGNKVTWTMFTEDGKTVSAPKSISVGNEIVDVSEFAAGVYFIQFNSNEGTITKKVIIQ